MNRQIATQTQQQEQTSTPTAGGLLQRKCACGNHTVSGGDCEECSKNKRLGLQTKLTVNEPGDIYEQEADRIADQVMANPVHSRSGGAPLGIQRLAGEPVGQINAVPASVDQTIASSGRPLEPALRQDMEQRFGYDFSQVRVHTGVAAEQSAREINANAYTLGQDVVFGERSFSPGTHAGRRLIAHELTHVVQQTDNETLREIAHSQPCDCYKLEADWAARTVVKRDVDEGRAIQLARSRRHELDRGVQHRLPSQPFVQLSPDDETQNVALDALGWVGDLIKVLGWSALVGGSDEESGRAALHLYHNMFARGEPIEVPRDWVMDSPSWRTGFARHKISWIEQCIADALIRDFYGESEGFDYASSTIELSSVPSSWCVLPWCEEADQFYASGNARFTIEGAFCWHPDESQRHIEIEFRDVAGSYRDYYLWEHEWDPGQHSRQERGWYTPFELMAGWEERVGLLIRVRLIELGEAGEMFIESLESTRRSSEEDVALERLRELEESEESEGWLEP